MVSACGWEQGWERGGNECRHRMASRVRSCPSRSCLLAANSGWEQGLRRARATAYGTEGQRFESSRARWFTRRSGARARDLALAFDAGSSPVSTARLARHACTAAARDPSDSCRVRLTHVVSRKLRAARLALVGVRGVYPAGGEG